MDSNGERTIRVLTFDGKRDGFNMWARKFMAQSKMKGYEKSLTADFDGSETKEEIVKMNDAAYSALILACLDQVSFNIMDTCKSTKYLEGDANKAWKSLMEHFQQEDSQSLVDINREINSSRLKNVEDGPEPWIRELL